MGAGRRTESYTGSHPPTLSPESAANFGHSWFLYLTPEHLAGVIFGCTHATIKECLEGLLFGLPYPHFVYVKNVQPGMPLFLFNYTDRKLHGIFEAASGGEIDINPHGWTNQSSKTPYPAQVRVKVRQIYPPLPENIFKHAIIANYQTDIHFSFELDMTQTEKLMKLFTKNASSVMGNPLKMPNQKIPQKEEEKDSDGWIKPKKTIKSSRNAWHEALPFVPSTHKALSAHCVSTMATQEHWEDIAGDSVDPGWRDTRPESVVTSKWEDHEQIGYGWEDGEAKEMFPHREYMDNSAKSSGDLPFDQTVRSYADKENKEPTIPQREYRGVQQKQQHCVLSAHCVSTVATPEHWEDIGGDAVDPGWKDTHPESVVTSKWEDHEQIGYGWEDGEEKEMFPQREYMDNSLESPGDLPFDQTVRSYADKENKEPTIPEREYRGVQEKQQQSEKFVTMWDASSPASDSLVENDDHKRTQRHFPPENLQSMKAQNSFQNGMESRAMRMYEPGKKYAVDSECGNWAKGGCLRGQILQGEEYKQQRGSLQEMGSLVNIVQTNLKSFPSANVLMRRESSDLDSSQEGVLSKEVDQLRKRNAVLEHTQGQLASEIGCLKLQITEMSHQLEALQQRSICSKEWIASKEWIVSDILDEKTASQGHGQKVYLLGGNDGESWLQNVDAIDPSTYEVKPISPMLFPRSYAAASVLMGQIYVFGGGNGRLWYETAEYFDNDKNEWLSCASMSIKRGSLAGATLGDRIFALGGGNGQLNFSEVECYDFHLGMWIASTSMLNKRFGVAAVELNGALYAMGGYNDRRYLASVERYDPREALWTLVAPLQRKRGSLSAAVVGGKIYAIGGYDGANFLSSVEVYEPRTNCWTEMENEMHWKRSYGSAVVVGDNIYMFGGYNGKQYLQTVERYHTNTGWETVGSAVVGKRCFHAGVVL